MRERDTGAVERACMVGPSAVRQAEYLQYYGAIDPFLALVERTAVGAWVSLRQHFSDRSLRRNEWYTDCLAPSGIGDMAGTCLLANDTHSAVLAIHYGDARDDRISPGPACGSGLVGLRGKAARLDIELGILNRRCSLLKRTLDRVPLAVAVVERTGRVIEMNRLADRLVQQDEVLCLRQCQLHAVNNDDDCALAKLVAQATAEVGRMLLANVNGLPRFLTVVPLGVDASGGTGAAGAILVSGQTGDLIPEQPLRALFGLSVAEGRLAVAVASGMRLTDFAALHGVRITTLRTQLSAILRKFRAQRQSDIVRLLLSAAAAGVSSEATSPDVPVDPAVT